MEGYTAQPSMYPYYSRFDETTTEAYPVYDLEQNWQAWSSDTVMMTDQSQALCSTIPEVNMHTERSCQQPSQQITEAYNTPLGSSQSTFTNQQVTSPPNSTIYFNNSPITPRRMHDIQVPTIITQFPSRSNTLAQDGIEQFPVMSAMNGMASLSAGWIRSDCNNNNISPDVMSDPGVTHGTLGSASSLQEAFQWHSPTTRRTSMSSSTSGPIFSPFGTPMTYSHHDSMVGTPYSQTGSWTPRSVTRHRYSGISPQSPSNFAHTRLNKFNQSWSRAQNQHLPSHQRTSSAQGPWQTMPARAKPRLEHAFSDSSIPNKPAFAYTSHVRPSHGRRRAISAVQRRNEAMTMESSQQQLDLPPYQLGTLFTSPSPEVPQNGFSNSLATLHAQTLSGRPAVTDNSQNPYAQPSRTGAHNAYESQANAPAPPDSDFEDGPHKPIPQQPHFDGDIYTPLWKRRDKAGNWEGWCHLCKPGVWLSMKTSRYWDDKKRNHGICANTRQKFPDPLDIRVVDVQGNIIDIDSELQEGSDSDGTVSENAWVVSEVDGSLRKRQGFCGTCEQWIPLDGPRSKVKGKMIGWWLHCYDCLIQSKKLCSTEAANRI